MKVSGMMRGFSIFSTSSARPGSRFIRHAQHATPPDRLLFSCPQHVTGRQLRRPVQAPGGGASGLFVGLAALWHWGPGDAALAAGTGRGSTDDLRNQEADFSGCLLYTSPSPRDG